MKKTIVVYYSKTGNNRYLAERIAQRLNGDIEEIRPRINSFPLVLLSSLVKASAGIRALKHDLTGYETVILCGPICMGQFLAPLRDFISRYKKTIGNFHFVTCCGSSDAQKNDKFGHARVFSIIKGLAGDKIVHCTAFPIPLVVPKDKINNGDTIMKTRLSDQNFTGDIEQRFELFINEAAS